MQCHARRLGVHKEMTDPTLFDKTAKYITGPLGSQLMRAGTSVSPLDQEKHTFRRLQRPRSAI